jgi:activator of HSP90 ATPase
MPIPPQKLFDAWLSSKIHSAMTGDVAKIEAKVGGKFTTGDNYIQGTIIELEPPKKIVQAWRTTEFSVDAPDSKLEIIIEATETGSKLTLIHSNVPEDQVDEYKEGWKDFYFDPMKIYFKKKAKKSTKK